MVADIITPATIASMGLARNLHTKYEAQKDEAITKPNIDNKCAYAYITRIAEIISSQPYLDGHVGSSSGRTIKYIEHIDPRKAKM